VKAPQLINTQSWPWAAGALGERESASSRTRPRRRPDVAGYFTFALISAMTSGCLVAADMLRTELPFHAFFGFAAHHPMTAILGLCVAVMAFLLAIGDV
jgi:hypothetical protein